MQLQDMTCRWFYAMWLVSIPQSKEVLKWMLFSSVRAKVLLTRAPSAGVLFTGLTALMVQTIKPGLSTRGSRRIDSNTTSSRGQTDTVHRQAIFLPHPPRVVFGILKHWWSDTPVISTNGRQRSKLTLDHQHLHSPPLSPRWWLTLMRRTKLSSRERERKKTLP